MNPFTLAQLTSISYSALNCLAVPLDQVRWNLDRVKYTAWKPIQSTNFHEPSRGVRNLCIKKHARKNLPTKTM